MWAYLLFGVGRGPRPNPPYDSSPRSYYYYCCRWCNSYYLEGQLEAGTEGETLTWKSLQMQRAVTVRGGRLMIAQRVLSWPHPPPAASPASAHAPVLCRGEGGGTCGRVEREPRALWKERPWMGGGTPLAGGLAQCPSGAGGGG